MGTLLELLQAGSPRTVCPDCGGGETHEKSFGVFSDPIDMVVIGRCYRSSCGFIQREQYGPAALLPSSVFTPTPLRLPYRLKELGLFGERALVSDPTVTVWQLYDLKGRRTGHITRTADKRIRTFKEVPEPVYYSNGKRPYGILWVFEDPKSAGLCAEPAVALLGTKIPTSLIADIKQIGNPLPTVFVALDPGAEDDAADAHAKLRSAGIDAVFVPMPCDFKDLDPTERNQLLETYAR